MRALRSGFLILVIMVLTLACGTHGDRSATTTLRLATTTSTDNSGLLDWLLPPFEQRENVEIQRLVVGTGQALALGENGDVDLVLVHARAREDAFVAAGHGTLRRDVMWNDFVIVGDARDPAGIRGSKDAAAALVAIAAAGATFVSRGDDSGTHTRERALWEGGGGRPDWPGYVEAGQGMSACLNIADEKRAYTLTDRGTLLSHAGKLELEVLVEGDTSLRNPYGVILVNPARHPHVQTALATRLIDYLTSEEGQRRIGEFRVAGEALFHPHSEGT